MARAYSTAERVKFYTKDFGKIIGSTVRGLNTIHLTSQILKGRFARVKKKDSASRSGPMAALITVIGVGI